MQHFFGAGAVCRFHPVSTHFLQHFLALELGVDVDSVRRHLCCEFYSHAMDAEGEETLLIVMDKRQMALLLLNIAGQRIAHHLLAGEDSKLMGSK